MHPAVTSFFTALFVSAGVSAGLYYGVFTRTQTDENALIEVPNLTGMTEAEAKAYLATKGLVAGQVEKTPSDTVPEGQVISSNPDRHSMVRKGLVIELVVSEGINTVEVPDVKRLWAKQAKEKLEKAGFEMDVKYIYDEDAMFDRILRQEPDAGTQAEPGTKVTVIINSDAADY